MGPYIDPVLYAGQVAPPIPMWYYGPFVVCLFAVFFGGGLFGRLFRDGEFRYSLMRQNVWLKLATMVAVAKFLTAWFTFFISLWLISVISKAYELWTFQTVTLVLMLFAATIGGIWHCGHELRKNLA